jgi:hypothetical protein
MASEPLNATTLAPTIQQRAENAFDQAYASVNRKTTDASKAVEHAASTLTAHLKGGGVTATIVGTLLSLFADILAVAVDQVTQVKASGQQGVHDLIAAMLSDSLLIEVDPADIPNGTGPGGQFRINAALGEKFLTALTQLIGGNGTVTGDTAQAGAAAMLGLGMQMSTNTALMALLGGCFPEVHLDELKELGEMLEKSLGLGRLTRQAMRPVIRNVISQPLDRKLRKQYRQDLIAPAEAVVAFNSGRWDATKATDIAAQHGLPDDQIAEFFLQRTPRLSAEELYTLGQFNEAPTVGALNTLVADGIPVDTATKRLRALQLKSALAVQAAYVKEVDKLVTEGFLDSTSGTTLLQGTTIPRDEVTQYQQKWSLQLNTPRKRLGMSEMLFLYEASQVTINEVQTWAQAEGYSPDDITRLLIYFEMKATGTGTAKGQTSAAAAAHVHEEHVAYVNDLFQGAYGRAPDAAELAGWVALLDLKQRTRADAKTEIKLSPTPPAQ